MTAMTGGLKTTPGPWTQGALSTLALRAARCQLSCCHVSGHSRLPGISWKAGNERWPEDHTLDNRSKAHCRLLALRAARCCLGCDVGCRTCLTLPTPVLSLLAFAMLLH